MVTGSPLLLNEVMSATPREHTRTYFLGKLGRELELRGMDVTLRTNPPSLRVSDPDTAMFTETVDCVAMGDGWFYRWSWGDVLASADDPSAAAELIFRVFSAPPPPPRTSREDR